MIAQIEKPKNQSGGCSEQYSKIEKGAGGITRRLECISQLKSTCRPVPHRSERGTGFRVYGR